MALVCDYEAGKEGAGSVGKVLVLKGVNMDPTNIKTPIPL